MRTAFIGLGVMGYPMAGHLAGAGHHVTVYNRTAAKAEVWVKQHGGASAATPAEAARDADVVFSCVGNDDDLRKVTAGDDGAFTHMAPGTIFVDHTTTSAQVALELAGMGGMKEIAFLDAPVLGGQAGAENGQLTVMVGVEQGAFNTAEPLMRTYGKAVTLMGPVGNAHQDGQPDLHRRAGPGAVGGAAVRRPRRTRRLTRSLCKPDVVRFQPESARFLHAVVGKKSVVNENPGTGCRIWLRRQPGRASPSR